MKATYTKPLLAIETFSLTQTITRDCTADLPSDRFNGGDPATCVWDLGGGVTVFVAGTNCMIDGESAGYGCYNAPSEENYIFRS